MKLFPKWKERREAEKKEKPPKPQKEKKRRKPKKQKIVHATTENPIKPKGNGLKIVAAVILWSGVLLTSTLGIINAYKPDPLVEYQKMTTAFISEQTRAKNRELELYAFASNFAKEYFTYSEGDAGEYTARVGRYTASYVNMAHLSAFKNAAVATYAQAYSLEEYAPGQYDVSVMVGVRYPSGDPEIEDRVETSYIKVPVQMLADGAYIVEDHPVLIAEPPSWIGEVKPFSGKEADDETKKGVETLLRNFLSAYYTQNQTSIDYYLSEDADRNSFRGLNSRYSFDRINTVRTYADPNTPNRYLSTVELQASDVNGQFVVQRFHLVIRREGQRYYIVEMNTRSGNLKENFTNN